MRDKYEILNELRRGGVIVIEGMTFVAVTTSDGSVKSLEKGDLYIAARNTGPHLLTVREIDPRGWVHATTHVYPFDTYECVPVREATEDDGPVTMTVS